MKADLVVRNAKELVTFAGPAGPRVGPGMSRPEVIENGAVAVKDGKIVFVGRDDQCPAAARQEIDATGKSVVPGFVDSHTHVVYAGSREDEFALRLAGRSYLEIARCGGGIKSTVKSTRLASREELVKLARLRLQEMLMWGTTTAEVKSGYGLDSKTEMKMLEAVRDLSREQPVELVPTYLGAHDFPPAPEVDRVTYIEEVLQQIPLVAERKLAKFCDIFCEDGFYTVKESERILRKGLEHGLLPKLHADELKSSGGAELAAKVGAVSADHLVYPSMAGLKAMKKSGTIAVLLPGTSFFLKENPADGRRMIEMGIPVAIATDHNPGSSPVMSMPVVIGLACLLYGFSPAEAMTAATVNGAWAVDLGEELGSIEVGKSGDLVVLKLESYLQVPYWFGSNPVERVVKRGEVVY